MERLLAIMAQLRDPQKGCPWDLKQTYKTIVPHTIEETYEVADAIERGDYVALCDELGDLLFQIVFYAQLAREERRFEFEDIVTAICDKLERRHPHVFGEQKFDSIEEQTTHWEETKQQERQQQPADQPENDQSQEGIKNLALQKLAVEQQVAQLNQIVHDCRISFVVVHSIVMESSLHAIWRD